MAKRIKKQQSKGLKFSRVFSSGKSPYDEVKWVKRTADIKDDSGKIIFQQKDVEVPEFYSALATNVVASKYFYGDKDSGNGCPSEGKREFSARQLVSRVADTIAHWGYADGYFASKADADVFHDDLTWLLLNQHAAFNSPVWFNCGLSHKYGVTGPKNNWVWDGDKAVSCVDAYSYPQSSACFIQSVDDDMGSIMDLAKSEAMLFKFGSGTGTDLSTLRSSKEKLKGGGTPSGPISFFKMYDTTAGIIKSGGKCLVDEQPVYTANGVRTAKELVDSGEDFTVLSYSRRLGRVSAKRARAWRSGEKPCVEVVTDKGIFRVSEDHPFMLKSGQAVHASSLKNGQRLLAVSTHRHSENYTMVGLQDGNAGKELLHRLVYKDLIGTLDENQVVHHGDKGSQCNDIDNLSALSGQSEHARLHNAESIAAGVHVFQSQRFPKPGDKNGMHSDSDFWKNEEKSSQYRKLQGDILRESGRSREMQSASSVATILNTGYSLINAGYNIETFESYVEARKASGRRCFSIEGQKKIFEKRFGSYENYYAELGKHNHCVVSVTKIGVLPVNSIEVFDEEPDDKRDWSEHNYTIAPIGSTGFVMNGVAILNTRRAARMNTLKCVHPDVLEFAACKLKEEKKAQALIAQGYESNFNGEAYSTVAFQNTNITLRLTDLFLEAVENNDDWTTLRVTDGKPCETFPANKLMDLICEGTWHCGDPGVQYEDTIQKWHTCPNTAPINSSNPCARKGSRLLTGEGWQKVEDLVGRDVSVYDGVGLVPGSVWHTGRKPIVRLHLSSGEQIDLTPDHQVYTTDGWIEAAHTEGKKVPVNLPNIGSTGSNALPRAITGGSGRFYSTASIDLMESLGFLQGDGTLRDGVTAVCYTPEKDGDFLHGTVLPILEDIASNKGESDYKSTPSVDSNRYTMSRDKLSSWLSAIGFKQSPLPERTLPAFVWGLSQNAQAAFLRGLYGANGCVLKDARRAITLVSSCQEMLREVQLLLRSMGIISSVRVHSKNQDVEWENGIYTSKESYRLEITNQVDITSFARLINFPQECQQEKLKLAIDTERASNTDGTPTRRAYCEIIKVEDLGIEDDVYDFNAPTTSMGMCNGFLIHNCCFICDTLVETMEGKIEIGRLAEMDAVGSPLPMAVSYDFADGKPVFQQITRAWKSGTTRTLVDVTTDGGMTFRCTPDHRFYQSDGSPVAASDLQTGDSLRVASDFNNHRNSATYTASVSSVTAYEAPEDVDVYDIEVEGTHNFSITHKDYHYGIIVSNSEYMFIDDSACNLSSINLLKFRREDGTFDATRFRAACRVMILAQEILVDRSSYPTQKICENSHKFRPLGLGYANLGALLMANGLAYDSREGRALAGCITAIMHGQANLTSSEVAAHKGPFEGFAVNREPMLRVMGMHRDAVEGIDSSAPRDLVVEARRVWDECLKSGEKYGYVNSQVTVLAPTGCVTTDTLILTDRGLKRAGRLGDITGKTWQDADFKVQTDDGPMDATKFFVNGVANVVELETKRGYRLKATPKHQVKIVDSDGNWLWKKISEISEDDTVPLRVGGMFGDVVPVPLPEMEQLDSRATSVVVPPFVTPEFAEFIGAFMANGSLHTKGIRISVYRHDRNLVERTISLFSSLFGLTATECDDSEEVVAVCVNSIPLRRWMETSGFAKIPPHDGHRGKGYKAHVPDAILDTNDPLVYAAFLRGVTDHDGTVAGGVPEFQSASREFIDDLKAMALAIGFPTGLRHTISGISGKPLWRARIVNQDYCERWMEFVGFTESRKAEAVRFSTDQAGRNDVIPVSQEVLDRIAPIGHSSRRPALMMMSRKRGISRTMATRLLAETGDQELRNAMLYFYDDVKESRIVDMPAMTVDLSVPENVTYTAAGMITHNTIAFLMDCATTGVEPDIALVKYKNLAGGGMLKIVNQTVPQALEVLGYSDSQITKIIDYIDANDTIEGAPGLKDEHLPVFDCAFKPAKGTRSIHYSGHIKMMAAAQPFLSGALSKTINIPESFNIDDIREVYLQGWKLGLKAIAIYRDGSKSSQPLNTKSDSDKKDVVEKPDRRRLPETRQSLTHKFDIQGHEGYITVGLFDDGTPGELFITMAKEGSTIGGLMDALGTSVSLGLQYGVPMEVLVNKFLNSRFEPSGFTKNRDIPIAKSVTDYIFRWLGLRFVDQPAPIEIQVTQSNQREDKAGAVTCSECGGMMIPTGKCHACTVCGSSGGCS